MEHDGGPLRRVPATVIATWPKGSFAENLAVDPSGAVFVTLHTDQAVVRVDPRTGEVAPMAVFDRPVAGLVLMPDASLLVSGGHPGRPPGAVWRIDPGGSTRLIAEPADALFLNGMTLHPDGRHVLIAESLGGRIYALDPSSGAINPWLEAAALAPPPGVTATPGANGIKVWDGVVTISVTAADRILRGRLAPDGSCGALEVQAERLRADDFAVGADGSLYIATHPAHSLVRLAPDGARTTLATAEDGLTGATAVAFGRTPEDAACVYVTTTGGTMTLPDEAVEPAKLVRLDIGATGAAG